MLTDAICLFLGHVGEYHYVSLQPLDEQNSINNVDLNECASKQSCLHTEHIAVVPPNEATLVPTASVSDSAVIQHFSVEVDDSSSSSTFIANQKRKTEIPAEFRKEPSQPRDVVAV